MIPARGEMGAGHMADGYARAIMDLVSYLQVRDLVQLMLQVQL